MSINKYVVVTAISQFKMRYVVSVDDLQSLNTDIEVDPAWLEEMIILDEIDDFSQKHLGVIPLETRLMTEDEVLELHDAENSYLKEWSKEQKLNYIKNLFTNRSV